MIPWLADNPIENKTVLLRVDFNVSLNSDHTIANDERVRQAIPTIKYLLERKNALIIVSHLGEPKEYDKSLSLHPVSTRLQELLGQNVHFMHYSASDKLVREYIDWTHADIVMLDNIRFWPGEKANDQKFAESLASLADVYVNDAFGVCHREDASIVSVPKYLPHYGGLLLQKEVEVLTHDILKDPQHPFVAIVGGAKVETKVALINCLSELADTVLIGGKLGLSTDLPAKENIIRPLGYVNDTKGEPSDIDEATIKLYQEYISKAKTVLWNGPVGKNEEREFAHGTDAIYHAIIASDAVSVIGGGDTITALAHEDHLEKISHISTGGGAMLSFIEHSTLPGLEALKS